MVMAWVGEEHQEQRQSRVCEKVNWDRFGGIAAVLWMMRATG